MSALICLVRLDLALRGVRHPHHAPGIRPSPPSASLAVEQGRVIAANNWGKAKTVSQMIAIITILFLQYVCTWNPAALGACNTIGQVLVWVTALLSVISGIIYLKDNADVLKG